MYNTMKLEKEDIIRQIGLFKDHSQDFDGPLLDLKLDKNLSNPTDKKARKLQHRLRDNGWEFYSAQKRRGNLYVQYVPAGAF